MPLLTLCHLLALRFPLIAAVREGWLCLHLQFLEDLLPWTSNPPLLPRHTLAKCMGLRPLNQWLACLMRLVVLLLLEWWVWDMAMAQDHMGQDLAVLVRFLDRLRMVLCLSLEACIRGTLADPWVPPRPVARGHQRTIILSCLPVLV